MTIMAITSSSNLSGQLRWQEVGNKSRHASGRTLRVSATVHTKILDIPNAQSTPTQPQSASPGTARFFVSSPAVAMPVELWRSTGLGGWAATSAMRNWSEFQSPTTAERTAPGWKAPEERRWTWRSWWPRGVWQDRPNLAHAHPRRPRRHSGLAGPSTPPDGPIKKLLPEACNADFLLAQETQMPKDALVGEESWMRSRGWRACIAPMLFLSLQHGEWFSTKQTAHSKGSEGGCSGDVVWPGDAARWCRRQRHRAVHGACACALPQWHCTRRGTDSLSLHACTLGWVSPMKTGSPSSWRTADGCPLSVALWWCRSSPRSPPHLVIDFFVVSRDLASACEATTQISHHIAPLRPVRHVVPRNGS